MTDSKLRIAGNETPDAEVELSAQDLLELAGPCDNNATAGGSTKRPQAASPKTTTTVAVPTAPARSRVPASRVSLSLALVLGAIGALYLVMAPSADKGQSSAENIRVPQPQLPASAPRSEGKPVLFANPFDANEVFEFPAGTSDAAARDAVAEILMERAMERQRQFDARVSSNR